MKLIIILFLCFSYASVGLTKEHIRIRFENSSRMMKVSGEQPIDGGNKRSRFNETYPVPQNCNADKIQGNLSQGIVTIIMPKKLISQVEVKPTQEQAPSQKAEQVIPPKSAREESRYEKNGASPSSSSPGLADMKAQKSPKGEEEAEAKPTLKMDHGKVANEKPQMDQEEAEAKPALEIAHKRAMDEKNEKGQTETQQKPAIKMVPRKPLDEKPEKGQEGTKQKVKLISVTEKQADDVEKERVSSNSEIMEEGKPSESRKPWNGVMEKSKVTENEIKAQRELAKADEHCVPKHPDKEKEITTSETAAAAAAANECSLGDDGMIYTIGKGIKELTSSASQAFARIAEGKWDYEDKPFLLNVGATTLVLAAAAGIYAFYSYSS